MFLASNFQLFTRTIQLFTATFQIFPRRFYINVNGPTFYTACNYPQQISRQLFAVKFQLFQENSTFLQFLTLDTAFVNFLLQRTTGPRSTCARCVSRNGLQCTVWYYIYQVWWNCRPCILQDTNLPNILLSVSQRCSSCITEIVTHSILGCI